MSLSERFRKMVNPEKSQDESLSAKVSAKVPADSKQQNIYQEIKSSIHRILIDELDISKLAKLSEGEARAQVRTVIEEIISRGTYPLNLTERSQLIEEVEDETFGLGPLEPLLHDPTVDDILVNSPKKVYVERFGKLELTDIVFKDEAHLFQVIDRIVSKVGRRIDESSPMVDARLADGSRVNAIIHPLVLGGPVLSIRRFKKHPLTAESLLKTKTLSEDILIVLKAAVKAKLNILICGGTGSGKTTLLNILSSFIPSAERIVTIEDAAELQLQQEHVIRLEVRPANIEGKGEVTQRDLVRNSLRMRPDRIIIGEVRGPEALDMLQAMNTGHEGSLTTIHANSPRDALTRLEALILMSGIALTPWAMRQHINAALDLVIHLNRCHDGVRRIMSLSEVTGMEGEIITMQDIFIFEQTGIAANGTIEGRFIPTGIKPKFADRLDRLPREDK